MRPLAIWFGRIMNSLRLVEKVVGLVTRECFGRLELLVIRHPTAGFQLPTGTVDYTETIDEAVKREVSEETGLSDASLVSYLGKHEVIMPEEWRIILRMTKLFDRPSFDASSAGYGLPRGTPVIMTGQVGKFAAILCDPLDHSFDPPVRASAVRGYVRLSILGIRLDRHFFHLMSNTVNPLPQRLSVDGNILKPFWTPLEPLPVLNQEQNQWLEDYYPYLLSSLEQGQQ